MNRAAKIGLITLLVAAAVSCREPKEPVEEDYSDGMVGVHPFVFRDVEKDGKVDFIFYSNSGSPIYTAKGYENHRFNHRTSKEMTPEMRDAASRTMAGLQDFNYELAKARYEAVMAKRTNQ